ncbi:unnamed protein product [Ectocarpus sp. CCAP 1310/34]|nr:unnamed protein product [Ectocarpus sp. CCAP 1310/34]
MPNWLASELCMVASFSLGAWKTFKVLKHGGTDYNLLKTWCLLGLLRAFEEYFEFLVSWIPFYWLGKCLGLGLLYLPGGNIPTVLFERVVVWGMDNAHHVLNNLVVPNVVEFAVSLPWRVLLVLFPTMPAPSSGSGSGAAKKNKKAGRGEGLRKKQAATGGGITSQLQHLNTPTKKRSAESTPKRAASAGAPSIQHQTPPLPERGSPSKTTPVAARNGVANAGSDSKHGGGGASALVAELLDADVGTGAALRADGAAAIATPVPFEDDIATSPESGGSGRRGSGGRPSRRRSFGEIIRSVVTGNSEVRLRDHLFDFSTASPAPPVPSGGGGGVTKPATLAASNDPVVPKKASPSASTILPTVVNGNGKRHAKEKVVVDVVIPPRSRRTTRRQPSEFSDPVTDGGGGGGDEAGGGGSSDGSSRVGREGVRRRNGGAGAGAGAWATERGTLRERKNASSSSLSSSSAIVSAPDSSRSSATRSARTIAYRRGGAATAGVARVLPRGTGTRAGAGTTASPSSSSAAAIVNSRAKRLAEWRKKRVGRGREEQAEEYRRSNNNFDGGGREGNAATRGVVDGSGRGGGEEESVRSAGGGARTRANASASAPANSQSRRFRHVERFRSEMARNGFGAPQNPPEDDAAAAAGAGASQRQRRVPLASSRTSRG